MVPVDATGRWSCVHLVPLSLQVLILCYFLPPVRVTLLTNGRVPCKVTGMGYLLMRGSFICFPSGPRLTLSDHAYSGLASLVPFFTATVPTPEQTYAVSRYFS